MTQKNVRYKARNIILGFFDENKKNALFQRTLLFICGLFIMAIGVDLSVKANLGVSRITSYNVCYTKLLRSWRSVLIYP